MVAGLERKREREREGERDGEVLVCVLGRASFQLLWFLLGDHRCI